MKKLILLITILTLMIVSPVYAFVTMTSESDATGVPNIVEERANCASPLPAKNKFCRDSDDGKLYRLDYAETGIEEVGTGSGMTYPAAGVAVSTGLVWDTSLSTDGAGDCGSGAVCLGDHTHSAYLTSEVDGSTTNELPTAGTLIDVSGTEVSVDTTEADDLTWGTSAGGSQTWTFDTGSGTDPTITISDSAFTFNKSLSANLTGAVTGNASTASVLAANGGNCSAGQYPLGVDAAGAVESCTADDDVPEAADYSNLTAGRSLTAPTAGTVDADAELYTDVKCVNISPAATTTDWIAFRAPLAMTITGIDCIVDAATSVVLTPRECDANGANCVDIEAAITCGTTNTTEASGVDNASIDAGDWVRVTRGTVTGTPTQASLCFELTWND